jgi:CheY-like chemotaxis protein
MTELRNKRVLIVDNNEEESGRLGVMLQRAGYDSIATWSGLEAIELLKSGEYDILLMSSYLPDVYVGDFFERLIGCRSGLARSSCRRIALPRLLCRK